jgi:hypothetical protein
MDYARIRNGGLGERLKPAVSNSIGAMFVI